jgi:hypothetical protein
MFLPNVLSRMLRRTALARRRQQTHLKPACRKPLFVPRLEALEDRLAPATHLVITGGGTIVAGNPFLFTVQAADSLGNPVTTYSGPTGITATATPADPQGNFPITGALNSSGFGFFAGTLKTAGSYMLTITAGTFSGTSDSLIVTPAAPSYFTVTAPAAATTGSPVNVTVTALDHFGNIATGYTGTVKLTSTDPAATGHESPDDRDGCEPGADGGTGHHFQCRPGSGGQWRRRPPGH